VITTRSQNYKYVVNLNPDAYFCLRMLASKLNLDYDQTILQCLHLMAIAMKSPLGKPPKRTRQRPLSPQRIDIQRAAAVLQKGR
jgi:hypothetical protein